MTYFRCDTLGTVVVVLGIALWGNYKVRIHIENSIVEIHVVLPLTCIMLVLYGLPCQFVGTIPVAVISIITAGGIVYTCNHLPCLVPPMMAHISCTWTYNGLQLPVGVPLEEGRVIIVQIINTAHLMVEEAAIIALFIPIPIIPQHIVTGLVAHHTRWTIRQVIIAVQSYFIVQHIGTYETILRIILMSLYIRTAEPCRFVCRLFYLRNVADTVILVMEVLDYFPVFPVFSFLFQ